jgi:hypothetical protein
MADPPIQLDASVLTPGETFFAPDVGERRRRALEQMTGPKGMDDLDPKGPSGHAYAVGTSTRLTSNFRRTHQKAAMDVTPQEVIDVLNEAGVKSWVLMGYHGYGGYMPDPRATQDVDVLIRHSERKRAKKAIAARWPQLVVRELEQVIRFMDPNNLDVDGRPKPVVDLMLPWATFHQVILKECVFVDDATQHRLPTLEAALVSKYAAMISRYRDMEKKNYDAGDFRRMVKANYEKIKRSDLRRLADLIYQGGGDEIEGLVESAKKGEPFTI